MASSRGRIDVHHHFVPPPYAAAMTRRGISMVGNAPLPSWSPDRSMSVMDVNGIETALLSLSCPGVYFGDVQEARDLARACNEFAAGLRDRAPDRFGMFAVLPMPFTEYSCWEATYALDTLKADGIVLLGSTEGTFLGDPRLNELMSELDRRRAIVFVHPNLHASSQDLELNLPGFLLEFLCDTTRAATNLVMNGTMERYPGITWILAHAGGFLPYVAWRLSLANLMAEMAPALPQGALTYIRRFYYDTALSPSPFALAALKELVDPSHILFGSDFPFAPEALTANQTDALARSTVLSEAEKMGIDRTNALALFPRLKHPGETLVSPPRYHRASAAARIRNLAQWPMLRLAERMRNR